MLDAIRIAFDKVHPNAEAYHECVPALKKDIEKLGKKPILVPANLFNAAFAETLTTVQTALVDVMFRQATEDFQCPLPPNCNIVRE